MNKEPKVSLSLLPRFETGEKILYFKAVVWAATGKSFPGYRLSVWVPPIQEMGLYVTDRRIILPAWILRLFRVEWSVRFGEVNPAADQDYLEEVTLGRNRLFGAYLELRTYNPIQHWGRSKRARVRLFMKSPESLCRLVSEACTLKPPTASQGR